MRRMPIEVARETTPPTSDDARFHVVITGELRALGSGLTEDAANRAAEKNYDEARASLAREGEGGRAEQIERVAEVLYAYHHAMVVNHGRGFPPGTPVPQAASDTSMNHFRNEARVWLSKVERWRETVEPEPGDTGALRGQAPLGVL